MLKIKDIRTKILLFFSILGLLILANYFFVSYSLTKLKNNAIMIEVAGENQELALKFPYLITEIVNGNDDARADLAIAYEKFEKNLGSMERGGEASILDTTIEINAMSNTFRPHLEEILNCWNQQKGLIKYFISTKIFNENMQVVDGGSSLTHTLTPEAQKKYASVVPLAKDLSAANKKLNSDFFNASKKVQITLFVIILLFTTLIIAGLIINIRSFKKNILKPLDIIIGSASKIAAGDLNAKISGLRDDEMGMLASSINSLTDRLERTSAFAAEIGAGKFDTDYEVAGENDQLGYALLEMRQNLRKVAEDDKQRNWMNVGLAQFSDILRTNFQNIEELSNSVVHNLIKYLNINQAGLFLIEVEDNIKTISLKACYAFNRSRFLNRKLEWGEGLVGQCILEREMIFISEVPASYSSIISGLGGAKPKSILFMPLKNNDEIFGAIELGSFQTFEKYQIEFIERIAQNIAATLAAYKTNERTRQLLEESQDMTEEMKAQEEEMRQNLEELQATQEEMSRRHKEMQEADIKFRQLTSNVPGMLFQFHAPVDGAIKFTYASDQSEEILGVKPDFIYQNEIDKILTIHHDEEANYKRKFIEPVNNAEPIDWTGQLVLESGNKWVHVSAKPATNESGETHYNGILTDVTAKIEKEQMMREMLRHQEKTENELREKMDELEEMQKAIQVVAQKSLDSEIKLKEAMKLAGMAYWEMDLKTQMFQVSEELFYMLGTSSANEGGTYMDREAFSSKFFIQEERAFLREKLGKVISATNEEVTEKFNTNIVTVDGSVKAVEVVLKPLFNDDKVVNGVYGIIKT